MLADRVDVYCGTGKKFSIADSVANIYASGHQSKVNTVQTPLILSQASQHLDIKYQNLSAGTIETALINPGARATGRQSWQEIK